VDYGKSLSAGKLSQHRLGIKPPDDSSLSTNEFIAVFQYNIGTFDETECVSRGVLQRVERLTGRMQPALAKYAFAFVNQPFAIRWNRPPVAQGISDEMIC
jgi:hypothetical protein